MTTEVPGPAAPPPSASGSDERERTGRSSSDRPWGPIRLAAVLVAGAVLGAVVTFIVQDRGAAGEAGSAPDPSTPLVTAGVAGTSSEGPPAQQLLLAWSIDSLPVGLAAAVAGEPGVERVTSVAHGPIRVLESAASERSGEGSPNEEEGPRFAARTLVPVDAIAIDPGGYSAFVPPEVASIFAGLRTGEVVMSRTGADLRGVGVGDWFDVESSQTPLLARFTVAGVVDDAVIGGAELAMASADGDAQDLSPNRYLLIAHHGDRVAIEDRVRATVPNAVRFRGPGETPFLRDGDAVLPQALVKARFGEFGTGYPGGGVRQDQDWLDDHLVDVDLPVLGQVRCHRGVLDDLRSAMEQIEREHLDYLIDPTPSSRACWYQDEIDRTGMLSRGYWGIAVVLNSVKNPTGSASVQDPRIVAIMQEHGFTWGGDFLVPEPAYFEFVGSVAASVEPPG